MSSNTKAPPHERIGQLIRLLEQELAYDVDLGDWEWLPGDSDMIFEEWEWMSQNYRAKVRLEKKP